MHQEIVKKTPPKKRGIKEPNSQFGEELLTGIFTIREEDLVFMNKTFAFH